MNFYSFLSLFYLIASLTSCYRAPGENNYCTTPITNNPTYTQEKSDPVTSEDMIDAVVGEGISYCVDQYKRKD